MIYKSKMGGGNMNFKFNIHPCGHYDAVWIIYCIDGPAEQTGGPEGQGPAGHGGRKGRPNGIPFV